MRLDQSNGNTRTFESEPKVNNLTSNNTIIKILHFLSHFKILQFVVGSSRKWNKKNFKLNLLKTKFFIVFENEILNCPTEQIFICTNWIGTAFANRIKFWSICSKIFSNFLFHLMMMMTMTK